MSIARARFSRFRFVFAGSLGVPSVAFAQTTVQSPDPAYTTHFQLPGARPLRYGDTVGVLAGTEGWLGVRYGVHPRVDVGAGVPYYLAGLTVNARAALVLTDHVAVSLWGTATVPFLAGDSADPARWMGFTWQGAGPAWAAGPLVSVWGPSVGVHAGLELAQRTQLAGLWTLAHVTLDARIVDGVRFLAQTLWLVETVPEEATDARRTLARSQPTRVLPYALAGVRLHTRRFAVDLGLMVAIGRGTPLAIGPVTPWPWLSATYRF